MKDLTSNDLNDLKSGKENQNKKSGNPKNFKE